MSVREREEEDNKTPIYYLADCLNGYRRGKGPQWGQIGQFTWIDYKSTRDGIVVVVGGWVDGKRGKRRMDCLFVNTHLLVVGYKV